MFETIQEITFFQTVVTSDASISMNTKRKEIQNARFDCTTFFFIYPIQ